MKHKEKIEVFWDDTDFVRGFIMGMFTAALLVFSLVALIVVSA